MTLDAMETLEIPALGPLVAILEFPEPLKALGSNP